MEATMDQDTNEKLDECKRILGIEEGQEIAEAPSGPKWQVASSFGLQGEKMAAATYRAVKEQDMPVARKRAWATVKKMAYVLKGLGFESEFRALQKALGNAPKS
jgi:hypothetical protein